MTALCVHRNIEMHRWATKPLNIIKALNSSKLLGAVGEAFPQEFLLKVNDSFAQPPPQPNFSQGNPGETPGEFDALKDFLSEITSPSEEWGRRGPRGAVPAMSQRSNL